MIKNLLEDLTEFTEMLESDIKIIKQGKSNLTADQIVSNIKEDLAELIKNYKI